METKNETGVRFHPTAPFWTSRKYAEYLDDSRLLTQGVRDVISDQENPRPARRIDHIEFGHWGDRDD